MTAKSLIDQQGYAALSRDSHPISDAQAQPYVATPERRSRIGRRLRNGLEWISSHPVVGAAAPMTAAVAGLFGSIYSTEIKGAFPFVWEGGKVVPQAAAFWTLLLAFSCMYGAILWGQNRSAARQFAQARLLSTQAAELTEAVRTLPPKGFLGVFLSLYDKAFDITHEALKAPVANGNPNDIDVAVRVVLDALTTLALRFDDGDHGPNDVYAANIFMYRGIASLTDGEFQALKSRLKFADKGLGREHYQGFLEIRKEFSTSTVTQEPDIDPVVPEIALAIPSELWVNVDMTRLSKILPGAPEALCGAGSKAFLDTATLADWCEKNGDFQPSVINELRQYFGPDGAGKDVKSFVSFAIPTYQHCGCNTPAKDYNGSIGVVNIHRNKPGMLHGQAIELFVPLTSPFCQLLSQLLHRRDDIYSASRKSAAVAIEEN